MRVFLCAGEPSGDLHGANLIEALRRLHPTVDCVGYGGERMAAAGCRLLFPLCQLAVMWFARVLANAPTFLHLLSRADRYFRHARPDAVVLIDYPGFNWWLARRAHLHGIPVFYFVPPQLWAWAGWRVHKMRRWIDHVLCTLPFEEGWYQARGVPATYVGHPYFDELARQRLDPEFLAKQRADARPVVGLLPGSRTQEVERNLSTLLGAAAAIHAARPDVRFLVGCFKEVHRQRAEVARRGQQLPLEVCVGRTPEIIHLAQACIAVSGSVGLELLYHCKPSVVVYRVSSMALRLSRLFKTTPYISLANLLAQDELFPEYLTDHNEARAIAGHIVGWLNAPLAHAALCADLAALRERVAEPGACARTARYILEVLGKKTDRALAA
jgi:lipid-A-disaccharide synthase